MTTAAVAALDAPIPCGHGRAIATSAQPSGASSLPPLTALLLPPPLILLRFCVLRTRSATPAAGEGKPCKKPVRGVEMHNFIQPVAGANHHRQQVRRLGDFAASSIHFLPNVFLAFIYRLQKIWNPNPTLVCKLCDVTLASSVGD